MVEERIDDKGGPRALTPEETVETVKWLRSRLFVNNLKITWRGMKIPQIGIGIFSVFYLYFMWKAEPEFVMFVILIFISFPMMMADFKYYNIYRISLYFRADVNCLYPTLLDRQNIVKNNIFCYLRFNILALIVYFFLSIIVQPYTDYSFAETTLILFNLLLLKCFLFMVVNFVETVKRRDRFGDLAEFFYRPIRLIIIFFFLAFDIFLLFIFIPEGSFFLSQFLKSPTAGILIALTIPLAALCWSRHILPFIEDYWQEDRIPLPAYLYTPAARYFGLFGEENREIDREHDLVGQLKILDEQRFSMKEKGTGFQAVKDKCGVIFWRQQFNLFTTLAVPAILLTAFICLFLDPLEREIFITVVGVNLIIFFIVIVGLKNPINQDTVGFENIYMMPFQAKRVIGTAIRQLFLAGLMGPGAIIVLTLLWGGPHALRELTRTLVIFVLAVAGYSILFTTATLHILHRFYPSQIQQTMFRSFPFMILYMILGMGYMIIMMTEVFEKPLIPYLFILVTFAIIALGPKVSLHLYDTISIMR